ncbi:MAG TPA: hypothetical protein VKJ65_01320, partial [Phycisphaerae bacterium]|nr:hypothetical protein [Phycisphaerae bacterium]
VRNLAFPKNKPIAAQLLPVSSAFAAQILRAQLNGIYISWRRLVVVHQVDFHELRMTTMKAEFPDEV